MSERINKSVSFSAVDPFEKELLNYAFNQGNFSKYVKRLIMMDKELKQHNRKMQQQIISPEPTKDDKKLEAMKSISL